MKIFYKEDLFRRLHERRPRLKERDFEDVYRCLIEFLKDDMKNNSTPYYIFPSLGVLYLPIKKAMHKNRLKTQLGLERYERLVRSYISSIKDAYYSCGLYKKTLLEAYNKKGDMPIEKIEEIQNEVAKNNKS